MPNDFVWARIFDDICYKNVTTIIIMHVIVLFRSLLVEQNIFLLCLITMLETFLINTSISWK